MDGQCTAQTATATTKIPFHGGKSKPSGDGLTTRTNLVDDKFWEITPSATDDDPAAFVTTWLVPAGDLSITIPTCPTTNTDCTNLSYSYEVDWGGGGTRESDNYDSDTGLYEWRCNLHIYSSRYLYGQNHRQVPSHLFLIMEVIKIKSSLSINGAPSAGNPWREPFVAVAILQDRLQIHPTYPMCLV